MRIPIPMLSTAILLGSITVQAQDFESLAGTWSTTDGQALVRIDGVGDSVDVVLQAIAPPLVQLDEGSSSGRIKPGIKLGDLRADPREGTWSGRLHDPDRDTDYSVVARLLEPSILELRGYVGLPFLGRTVHWVRLAEFQARVRRLWAQAERP